MPKATISLKTEQDFKEKLVEEAENGVLSLSEYIRRVLHERNYRADLLEEMRAQEREHTEDLQTVRQEEQARCQNKIEQIVDEKDSALEQKERRIVQLEAQLEKKNEKILGLEDRIADFQAQISADGAREVIDEYEKVRNDGYEAGKREAQEKIDDLKSELHETKAELDAAKKEIDILSEEGAAYFDKIKQHTARAAQEASKAPSIWAILYRSIPILGWSSDNSVDKPYRRWL